MSFEEMEKFVEDRCKGCKRFEHCIGTTFNTICLLTDNFYFMPEDPKLKIKKKV